MPTPDEIQKFIKMYQRRRALKKMEEEELERKKKDDYYQTIKRVNDRVIKTKR